jgi:hypothetical protein
MAAADYLVNFGANLQNFTEGCQQVKSQLSDMAEAMHDVREAASDIWDAFIISEGIDKLKEFVEHVIDLGESMEIAASQTGMTTEAMSAIKLGASETGINFQTMTGALARCGSPHWHSKGDHRCPGP